MDVTIERGRLAGLESDNASLVAELADRLRQQTESERDLRIALEAGRFGAWSLQLATGELTTTEIHRTIFGRDPGLPLTYEDQRAQIHPDDRDRTSEALDLTLADGRDYDIEYRIVTPDGRSRWVGIRGRPEAGPDGRFRRIAGVSADITNAKRAERIRQAYVDLADRFRDLQDPSDLSYAAAEIIGRALDVDRAGYGTIRVTDETIAIERDWTAPGIASLAGTLRFRDYGSYIEDLMRGETVVFADARWDARTAPQAAALEAISARSVVNMPLTEHGGLVALLYLNHATPREWHPDELGFVRDIAERTRAAVERRRAESELAALAASLEQQVAERTRELMSTEEALRQSQKMEAIGQLTGGVAHDFNNLLTVIRSSVDLMRRPGLSEDRRARYLEAISDTVTRASKLTAQLLAFARRQALQPETADVGTSIAGIAEMVGTLAGSRIVLDVHIPDGRHWVHVDPAQLDTAVVNLTLNARDAMNGEGRIIIRVGRAETVPAGRAHPPLPGDFVTVAVSDEGSGISPDHLERIFEPFFTTKDVGQGTGLGLSQVFGFVKQSGGEVRVESDLGRGTTFTLYFPRVEAAAETEPVGDPESGNEPLGGEGLCVLVVEDNEDVGRFATRSLAELGYQTVWASNAAEAMSELDRAPDRFDVVFSDVVMPGMSGVVFARTLREIHPDLPIVLTSGYSHVLAESGPDGFDLLQKPYSIDQLARLLDKSLRRRARPA